MQAQSKCPDPPEYELLRQDEDYSYLRNDACKRDRWDFLKYVRLGSSGDSFLTIGGEAREWYEGFRNFLWGVGPQDDNGYLLQRFMAYGDFHVSRRLRFFAQLTSNIEAGRNGGPRPVIDESKLWFKQAFADITLMKGADGKENSLVMRLGRQEFFFGSGRLVDPREGPNVRQAFDGIALIRKKASWDVRAFATKPVLNGTGFFDAPPDPGITFWGIYAVRPLPKTRGGNIDLYYLGLDRNRAVFDKGVGRVSRHTIGTRFWGKRGGWDYNSEATLQLGTFGDGGIRAWANAHDTGYTFRSARFRPRVAATLSVASGDNGNPKSPLGTFSPLFPTGLYYGQGSISLNGPSNIIQVDPYVELQITKSVRVIADSDFFWRTSLRDGVYGLGSNLFVSGKGNSERYVGSQPSVGVYWQFNRHLLLSAAYDHFFAGPFLVKATPPRRSVDYAAAWLTYKF
ncbi:MAG TPA: alginate export family protein [Blastocatellia bacterium]|nr:alginate export family protein [Blastocatellia bacterium]